MKNYIQIILLIAIFLFNIIDAYCQSSSNEINNDKKNYPIPPHNSAMLFYIQRTHNTNTIVYEINYNKDSTINENEPIKIYWIRYDDNGETIPLTSVQKKFAYGVNATFIDNTKKYLKISLTAYDKAIIYVQSPNKNNTYKAYTKINNKLATLTSLFFKTDGGSFWSPNVVYVELNGHDIKTGVPVTEKFKP